jgi:adenylate kinase
MKQAVIIYGPPGAGKGTQANLLAWIKNYYHFDTGKYIEEVVHNPDNQKNSAIQRERRLFDTGELCTPSWVLKIVSEKTKKIAKAGFNIIFSGSPRTVFEAFGDKKNQGLIEILERSYGRKNIKIFLLKIKPATSIKRNSGRMICSICATPILAGSQQPVCSICSAPLRKRILDNPETIKIRLQEYKKRTYPILDGLKSRGYKITEIDGEPPPYKIHQNILRHL